MKDGGHISDHNRQSLGVADHRRTQAFAKLNEIGAKRHLPQTGRSEMTLHGGDRHNPVVGIPKVSPSLLGLHLASTLQQYACNDLETVGDPMLDLLQKDRLFPNKIILLSRLGASESDVGYRQQQPDPVRISIFELARVQQQASRFLTHLGKAEFIGLDLDAPGRGRLQ